MGRRTGWDDDNWGVDDDDFEEKEAKLRFRQNKRRLKHRNQDAAFEPIIDEDQ